MKTITAKVELTHNGTKLVLEGTEAQTALARLQAWDGSGSVAINYTDPATKQPQGLFMCCGDTWKRLPNVVAEVEEMPCTFPTCVNTGDEPIGGTPDNNELSRV